jgi:hypothetical protein
MCIELRGLQARNFVKEVKAFYVTVVIQFSFSSS